MNLSESTAQSEFIKRMWVVTWVTLALPPLTGIFMLSFVGVFPFPEVFYPFTDYALIVVIIATIIGIKLTQYFIQCINQLANKVKQAGANNIHLKRLPLYYFSILFSYFAIGLVSTLYSLSTLHGFDYQLQKYIVSFLGVIPGGLITALPIFFYLTDALGQYLAPRGIHVSVAPIKLKLVVLGLFIPVFIDTLLIMYFYDRTGYFSYETIGIWLFLILIAAIGTLMAWKSFKQSLSPFVNALEQGHKKHSDINITPQSLDELGLLSKQWHDLWGRVLDYEKVLSTSNITLRDNINEQSQQLDKERQFINKILDNTGAMVLVLDKNAHVVRFNNACESITGFKFKSYKDKPVWEWLLPPEKLDEVKHVFSNLIDTMTDSQYENEILSQDGQRILVTWNNSIIRGHSGKVQYIISIGIDTSAQHAAQQALEIAKEEAEQANKAKSEFLSRMSHELRTPMNAILGFAQLLQLEKSSLTDTHKSFIDEIIVGGKLLLTLINEILDLAKIEEGKLDISIENCSATKIINESVSLLKPQAQLTNISIKNNVNMNIDYIVKADTTRLKQACINVLSNAIKYNSENGTVDIDILQPENGLLRISIKDTGAGIPPDEIDKLFKPFERLNNDKNNSIEGTGIGLALSKKLMNLMNGEISVKSVPEQGCTFFLDIPLVETLIHQPDSPENIVSLPDKQNHSTHRYTVLYVEDNPPNLRLVNSALKSRPDINLITAHTGTLGLEIALSHVPDVVLLDINLPGINGIDILKHLKNTKETLHIPVIAISANAMPHDIQAGLDEGFNDYLVKPLVLQDLFAILQHLIPEY